MFENVDEQQNFITLNKGTRITLTFSNMNSSFAHLVNYTYQILYHRLIISKESIG